MKDLFATVIIWVCVGLLILIAGILFLYAVDGRKTIPLNTSATPPHVRSPGAATPTGSPSKVATPSIGPSKHAVTFVSYPGGARLYIDGKKASDETTPVSIHLSEGMHIYRVAYDDDDPAADWHKDVSGAINVTKAERINVWLEPFSADAPEEHALVCGGLELMGRGELGAAPEWSLPYCTADAEQAEKQVAESLDDFIFMQSYEALVDKYGGALIASDIRYRMIEAGYTQVENKTTAPDVATSLFVNPDAGTGYIVMLREKDIDYHLLVIKTKL